MKLSLSGVLTRQSTQPFILKDLTAQCIKEFLCHPRSKAVACKECYRALQQSRVCRTAELVCRTAVLLYWCGRDGGRATARPVTPSPVEHQSGSALRPAHTEHRTQNTGTEHGYRTYNAEHTTHNAEHRAQQCQVDWTYCKVDSRTVR